MIFISFFDIFIWLYIIWVFYRFFFLSVYVSLYHAAIFSHMSGSFYYPFKLKIKTHPILHCAWHLWVPSHYIVFHASREQTSSLLAERWEPRCWQFLYGSRAKGSMSSDFPCTDLQHIPISQLRLTLNLCCTGIFTSWIWDFAWWIDSFCL